MADLRNSKSYGTATYPVHALSDSGLLSRCEPVITPDQLISRYLLGIPLRMPNGDVFTREVLKDRIVLAMNDAELLIGTNINPIQRQQKAPFDFNLYRYFIHITTEFGPILAIQDLSIVASDGTIIFTIPSQWIEAANFTKGLINVIPLLAAFGATNAEGTPITATSQGAGVAFLAIYMSSSNSALSVPAYWGIKYTTGLTNVDGQIPVPVNQIIAITAAIDILSNIATTFIHTSQSLSQDGLSQSSSGPGPRLYQLRIEELTAQRDKLVQKVRGAFKTKFVLGNI